MITSGVTRPKRSAHGVRLLLASMMAGFLTGCIGSYHLTKSGVYHGRVLDAETSTPVVGAKAELLSTLSTSTKSDQQGWFVVGPLRCSHFGVRVPPEGFWPQCRHSVGVNLAL